MKIAFCPLPLFREKVVQECPQTFLNHEIKIVFPLIMRRANAARILHRTTQKDHRTPNAVAFLHLRDRF